MCTDMTENDYFIKLIQEAKSAEVLEELLEEQALIIERNLFLLSDDAQKFTATTGSRLTWFKKDIEHLEHQCRIFWFLRKRSWILMQMK